MISDLAITEIVSAISRRRREGVFPASLCAHLHRKILGDIDGGLYLKNDLMPEVHREAERLLLAIDGIALRAADAFHLALASLSGAAAIVTTFGWRRLRSGSDSSLCPDDHPVPSISMAMMAMRVTEAKLWRSARICTPALGLC
jgi:hypothetical protein